MAHKMQRSIIGAKLPTGETITGGQAIQFESEEQMNLFIQQIEAANNGDLTPIILPDGQQLRQLTNGEKWLLDQLMRVNLFLLLLSIFR